MTHICCFCRSIFEGFRCHSCGAPLREECKPVPEPSLELLEFDYLVAGEICSYRMGVYRCTEIKISMT